MKKSKIMIKVKSGDKHANGFKILNSKNVASSKSKYPVKSQILSSVKEPTAERTLIVKTISG